MINLTKIWTGVAQPADSLRYGHASGHPANHASNGSDNCMPVAARARKPITVSTRSKNRGWIIGSPPERSNEGT